MFTQNKEQTGAKYETPRIENWMVQHDSFEMDVNQYGFYNTVKLEYKDGVVVEAYEDLVRIYGEVPIEYKEKGLDKTTAELKAKAYLSAHIRDFGMNVKVKVLYSGKFQPSTFVRVTNPLTLNEELYFIEGISVSYDAKEETWIGDLTLVYGPQNPDDPEIPEVGSDLAGSPSLESTTNYPADWYTMIGKHGASPNDLLKRKSLCGKTIESELVTIAKNAGTPKAVYNWVNSNIVYAPYENSIEDPIDTVRTKNANCGDHANLICTLMSVIGYQVKIVHVVGHYYAIVNIDGQWTTVDPTTNTFSERQLVTTKTLGDKW